MTERQLIDSLRRALGAALLLLRVPEKERDQRWFEERDRIMIIHSRSLTRLGFPTPKKAGE